MVEKTPPLLHDRLPVADELDRILDRPDLTLEFAVPLVRRFRQVNALDQHILQPQASLPRQAHPKRALDKISGQNAHGEARNPAGQLEPRNPRHFSCIRENRCAHDP